VTLERILESLATSGAEFIVVGGIAAIFHGALETTLDVDLVHARDEVNRAKILAVLVKLEAVFREHLPKRIPPTLEHLASAGHLRLMTNEGPLDLLGTVSGGLAYEDLASRAEVFAIGAGLSVQVVALEQLIEIKQATGRAKDLRHLEQLREVLRLRKPR